MAKIMCRQVAKIMCRLTGKLKILSKKNVDYIAAGSATLNIKKSLINKGFQ